MTRALYIVGPPGVGKTSVMDALLEPWVRSESYALWGLLRAEVLVNAETIESEGYHLGARRLAFGGTDTLGMAVQPDAVAWVSEQMHEDVPNGLVFGEGQRLGNAPFLTTLAKYADLTVVHLIAKDRTLDERCAQRGSTQSQSWRRGAATRSDNATTRCAAAGVRTKVIYAGGPLAEVVEEVRGVAGL